MGVDIQTEFNIIHKTSENSEKHKNGENERLQGRESSIHVKERRDLICPSNSRKLVICLAFQI